MPFMDTETNRAKLSIARGKAAAAIKDPKERRRYIARQGKVEMYGQGWSAFLKRLFKLDPNERRSGFDRLLGRHENEAESK